MTQKTRTTVALPVDLLGNIDEAVRAGRVISRNEFIAAAIRHELERLQREAIDNEFEAMAGDEFYQRESKQICSEYEYADRETLQAAEPDS